ncbi:MAG: energy transducer TonB [Bacteroidota bacterium]
MEAITSTQFVIFFALLAAGILGVIFGKKFLMNKARNSDLASKYADDPKYRYAKKYPEADAFGNSPMYLRIGIISALLLTMFAFAWTTYDKAVYIPTDIELPEDIEMEPPRTAEPPPPPPPPPPPVIEEVPEEEVEEEIEFEDMTVEEETVVEAPPEPVEEEKPPPPPPPEEPEEEDSEEIFTIVQQMPRFPGCEDIGGSDDDKKKCAEKKMLEYIYKNIKYPSIARENGIEGMAVVSFVVDKKGKITDPKVVRDPGGGCGKEALRIVQSMPTWTPGKQRNRPVKVQFNLPVRFKLEN